MLEAGEEMMLFIDERIQTGVRQFARELGQNDKTAELLLVNNDLPLTSRY
jgi:hypothetical protein